ncbi:uncharacterized protein LOC121860714 [Homarus americanus]|uniref:Proline-rich transmembrane protein 3/4 domain-containing protein n=1 Tax=Homarus americanus TaxID=6706 RepID=A0A8J5N4K2_HOMAM|nr:uncharacterized protein LOC121860714 [Homarus americanus]KAG7173216.1 hypothetical protein Hamer_G014532 [Homarus americanus]
MAGPSTLRTLIVATFWVLCSLSMLATVCSDSTTASVYTISTTTPVQTTVSTTATLHIISTTSVPGDTVAPQPRPSTPHTQSTLEDLESQFLFSVPDGQSAPLTTEDLHHGFVLTSPQGQFTTPTSKDLKLDLRTKSAASEASGSRFRKPDLKPIIAGLYSEALTTVGLTHSSKSKADSKVLTPKYFESSVEASDVSLKPYVAHPLLSLLTNQVMRRSAESDTVLASDSLLYLHRPRQGHADVSGWLKSGPGGATTDREKQIMKIMTSQFEEEIAQVFKDVAYRGSSSKSYPPFRRPGVITSSSSGSNNRIERTTALSENPHYDYVADGRDEDILSGRRNVSGTKLSVNVSSTAGNKFKNEHHESDEEASISNNPTTRSDGRATPTDIEKMLEVSEYDHELYDLYEGHYSDFYNDNRKPEITRRGDAGADTNTSPRKYPSEHNNNYTDVLQNETLATQQTPQQQYKATPRLSWFDALLCSNRNLAWILINFLLGFLLFGLSLLAVYRLLMLKSCTHLLPRTHFVTVHLLIFIASFLKALYLFHLAYGSKDRLPLVLVLLLTNTGLPCFSSAFLILMIMMFLTADVQVYKPKLFTMQNISIFIIMKFVLCFIADVIVGCAHSKSVLVLSRVMVIIVASAVVMFYARKHQMVVQVFQMLKREFQGELKLLVVPSKDLSQDRQMGIKHILRSRLHLWCKAMNVSAVFLTFLCLIHLSHTVFLISSHVPAWAWWLFHISGCLVETLLAVTVCVAAALTQRYDEKIHFLYSFLVPSSLLRSEKAVKSKERNGNVIYQRVSFSSGTESTQYTTCFPEAGPTRCDPPSRTPKAPRRRGATVKRSATFSHGPQHQYGPGQVYGPPMTHAQVLRTGSASQIPIYSTGSHVSIYGPSLVSQVPIYSPPSVASMLVHEDGFVRIRTQLDPRQANQMVYNSQSRLQDPRIQGSTPQLHGSSPQQLNGLGRQESFYQSLSRKRRNSRSSDILQNNIDVPESDYLSSPSSRRSYIHHPNLPPPLTQETPEPDYQSLSRRRRRRSSRDPNLQHHNNIEKENNDYHSLSRRRRSAREHPLCHMNNLDRPESDYHSLTRRQVSQEDNNYPPGVEVDHHVVPGTRRSVREPILPPLNFYEEPSVNYRLPPHCGSPSTRHKISNFPTSPTESPVHTYLCSSPGNSRRAAQFPKPFVRAGSNASLQGEENYHWDHLPRGNPVRRNHSSAGYFPSRNMAPPSPSLTDTHRYGSLRLGVVRKRQPGYVINTNTSKMFNKYRGDRYLETKDALSDLRNDSVGPDQKAAVNGPSGRGPAEDSDTTRDTNERECPSRQSERRGKTGRSGDQDWALELIKSSSILTDFYSLEKPEDNIPEEGEMVSEDKDNG